MLLFGDDRGNIHSYKFDDIWGGTNVPTGERRLALPFGDDRGWPQISPLRTAEIERLRA